MTSPEEILKYLQPIDDPELQFSIVDLGLIYDVYSNEGKIVVLMTLTTPTCPLQDHFVAEITKTLSSVPGVTDVEVVFTFTPRWTLQRASTDIKEALALRGIGTIEW